MAGGVAGGLVQGQDREQAVVSPLSGTSTAPYHAPSTRSRRIRSSKLPGTFSRYASP
jgi:hypothetical protein